MKIVVVWVCLLAKVNTFPTEPPPNAEEKKPCCVGPPRLLFKGYDSKHGINVFLFEFPPLKNVSKSNVKGENTEHSNTASEGTANTENGNEHELAFTETNTPAYPHVFTTTPTVSLKTGGTMKRDSIFPESSMNLSPTNNPQHELDLETNSSFRVLAKNDAEKYRDLETNDITVGDEARNTEEGITNGYNDVDGYYSTEGITLTDISGYSDSKVAKQDPDVQFPFKHVENGNVLDCSTIDGLCKNTSKYTEGKQVTHPTTHDEVNYPTEKGFEVDANVTQSSKNHKNKPSERQNKLVTHKDKANKQPDLHKTTIKQSITKLSTNRSIKRSSKQRQRYAHHVSSHNRHYRYHHSSSSESTSDSSQQFG